MARGLALQLGKPLKVSLLSRVRATNQQALLNAEQRQANLTGAFQAFGVSPGLQIGLVDDVITTGATMAACAHCLEEKGARVVGLALAIPALSG